MTKLTPTQQRDLAQQKLANCVIEAAAHYWSTIQNAKQAGLYVNHNSSTMGTGHLSVQVTRMGDVRAKQLSYITLRETP